MSIRLDGQVAIVTGAGNGLGKSHALALAGRGARVVVNDLGGASDGTGGSATAAEQVAALICEQGGEAIANAANITDPEAVQAMVAEAMDKWGRVDILVNNAGILRDRSFTKMSLEEFRVVIDVHLTGAFICTKAVWDIMKEQQYGRIVMTSSASGLYGNFGQSNYSAAKMGLVGLMNTLAIEGQKNNIHVNALAPTAATRMTEELIPDKKALELLTPQSVTAGMLTLCHQEAPTRFILCAGAGGYACTRIYETEGVYISPENQQPENLLTIWEEMTDDSNAREIKTAFDQTWKFVDAARKALQQAE